MKKVFSVKKFKECCKMMGLPNEEYEKSCKIWAIKCNGLTEEEMNELGYLCTDDWMIEVEERKMKVVEAFIQSIIDIVVKPFNELMEMLEELEEENKE